MARSTPVKSFTDSLASCPCLCSGIRRDTTMISYFRKNLDKRMVFKRSRRSNLYSSATRFQHGWQLTAKTSGEKKRKGNNSLVVVNDLGGQYEDMFTDVKIEIINYFTFKAVRTVLEQLYEMNPPQYQWFNNFVADNVPSDAKRFLQTLFKERREIAERVMITRLSLYSKWIKKCDHEEIYKEISDENLELMRERLLETIVWPADDSTKSDETAD